ncbi:complement component C8 gamma chain isoform X2 [Microcaecilia unicolor]|uniref:Complement component C8 gamma chain isoform X2 n=1 Tax=Microcaecilia unicolor TaxID=1415580 RepID=A0A6P7YCX2_9AMPH|nr:complement component C8 gamma chain isoform X2 [Microcaecilia unicolor]
MRSAVGILFLTLFQFPNSQGQSPRRPPKPPESPIEKIKVQDNFNLNQFAGKWFLIGVASECNYLKEHNFQLEGTTIVVSQDLTLEKKLPISTFRKLDGICWEIKQEYKQDKVLGRFLLTVRGYGHKLNMVVANTDYSSYAILYYQKQRTVSIKLYARSVTVNDDVITKYENRVRELNIGEDFIYYFPKYGFCDSVDQFHILNEAAN